VEDGIGSSEERGDVFPIIRELVESVRESERGRSAGSIPRDGPIPAVTDFLRGFDGAICELNVANLRGFDVVIGGGELPSEDRVEVDGSTGNDIVPFGIWEFRAIR
jgi:hypothetical protein